MTNPMFIRTARTISATRYFLVIDLSPIQKAYPEIKKYR
jgi:hypothetical protein